MTKSLCTPRNARTAGICAAARRGVCGAYPGGRSFFRATAVVRQSRFSVRCRHRPALPGLLWRSSFSDALDAHQHTAADDIADRATPSALNTPTMGRLSDRLDPTIMLGGGLSIRLVGLLFLSSFGTGFTPHRIGRADGRKHPLCLGDRSSRQCSPYRTVNQDYGRRFLAQPCSAACFRRARRLDTTRSTRNTRAVRRWPAIPRVIWWPVPVSCWRWWRCWACAVSKPDTSTRTNAPNRTHPQTTPSPRLAITA